MTLNDLEIETHFFDIYVCEESDVCSTEKLKKKKLKYVLFTLTLLTIKSATRISLTYNTESLSILIGSEYGKSEDAKLI